MEPEITVSCQVPIDWKEKIDRLAAERKKEPQQVIYEALALYLGEDARTTDKRFLVLETELTILQKEQMQLSTTVKNLQQKLQAAASMIGVPDSVLPILPCTAKASPVQTIDDDDYEDEPDEILYDFLPPELR